MQSVKLKSIYVNWDMDYKHGIGAIFGLHSVRCITQRKNYFSTLQMVTVFDYLEQELLVLKVRFVIH